MKLRVLICGDLFVTNEIYQTVLEEVFRNTPIYFDIIHYTDPWPTEPLVCDDEISEYVGNPNEVAELVKGMELILTHSAPVNAKAIDAATTLKAVAAARGGPVNINVKACTERGIPVFYAPGSKGGAVADFTIGLMLAELRSIARAHFSMKHDQKWRGDLYAFPNAGIEMAVATVGLVGFGAIGKRVAQILKGFGARVLVYDPYVSTETIHEMNCEAVDLDHLLQQSDIVSLHARLTPETRGLLGAHQLAKMKPTAILVNTSRAELVNEQALIAALEAKQIAGAALDVFTNEPPLPDSPLYRLDNITMTSHLGGATRQAAMLGAKIAVDQVYKFLTRNEKPQFCINPNVLR